jgi:hypothetical protein
MLNPPANTANKRGRPIKSQIRQNIIDLLQYMKRGYGYDIYKVYVQLFPKVTMRSIYYNLKKGVALDEIKIEKVEKEKGKFSWGDEVEKTYYSLGKNANPRNVQQVREFFGSRGK